MTPSEYKDQLIEQYNQTVVTLQQLQGAITACDALLADEDQDTTEEETSDE